MSERKDVWYAVVNPNAGAGRTISEWQKAEIRLRQRRVHYTSVKTEHAKHAIELTIAAATKGYRKFVAVGGDGTVHEVLNGIMKFLEVEHDVHLSEFTLAVIPIGSGNDWIKAHDVPNNTLEVVDIIAENRFFAQDVVKVTRLSPEDNRPVGSDYMLNVGGIGFDARVCEIVNIRKAMGKGGKLVYFRALLNVLRNFYSFEAQVYADGELVYDGECYSMALGVGPWSGGGMRQVPSAILNDGKVDLLVIPKMNIGYLVTHLLKLFTGTLETVPELIFKKAKIVNVLPKMNFADAEPVEVDGEVVGNCPVIFTVMDEQIKVLSRKRL